MSCNVVLCSDAVLLHHVSDTKCPLLVGLFHASKYCNRESLSPCGSVGTQNDLSCALYAVSIDVSCSQVTVRE